MAGFWWGGAFQTVNGLSRPGLVRLNQDGTVDLTFNPTFGGSPVLLQPDGKILVGGRLRRLNPDGSLDVSFLEGPLLSSVRAIALQPDGKVLVGGSFSSFHGEPKHKLARLFPNGIVDQNFVGSSPSNDLVDTITVQHDNKLLLGGNFSVWNGLERNGILRLHNRSTSIQSINPESPNSAANDQWITVIGSGFQSGLTVAATFPNGQSATLSGTQIQQVTPTSFRMRITLGTPGEWSLRVNNPDGAQSNTFLFTVQSGVQAPTVFSVTPETPSSGNFDQDVFVSGTNFQQGLTVRINFPNGGDTLLHGSQIQNVTPTSFIMRATLNEAGPWSMVVNNPDGGVSSQFGFNVAAGGNGPVVASINPGTPVAGGADQDVTVNGVNFQAGLRVNVAFPDGGISGLQGTGQIQEVTPTSFKMRITLNAEGQWRIRVVNPDNTQSPQFTFTVNPSDPPPTGLPTSVLSPVIGPICVKPPNQCTNDGRWEFNQHGTGAHTPLGGISKTDDTKAWDINLRTLTNSNEDAGKAVFAVAPGEVVSFVGTPPGGGPGAVLIAHPNAANPVWFSGYLHLKNVLVQANQAVTASTLIGQIGRTGSTNDHLHFAIYSGTNRRGNLSSFSVPVIQRVPTGAKPPSIISVTPDTVNQASEYQELTIFGENFDTSSFLEVKDPNGEILLIVPKASSGLTESGSLRLNSNSSITAEVPFPSSGTYSMSVVSALHNQSSADRSVTSHPSGRTPVIVIPGIMGSRIGRRGTDGYYEELWPGGAQANVLHLSLKNDVENPDSAYRHVRERNVNALGIVRNIGPKDYYGNLVDYLTGRQGYTLDRTPFPASYDQCHSGRNNADLFVFPYDWRNSNSTSAKDLKEFVNCIRAIRGYPTNFKVDIIAHSMGGLVARRYILDNSGNHSVDRVVTLGTPWLGAPKTLNTLEYGDKFLSLQNLYILPGTIRTIAPYMRGAHELIPSRAYVDELVEPWNRPLGEDGWADFDVDPSQNTPVMRFNFDRLRLTMNDRYDDASYNPGNSTDVFHTNPGQDDWRNRTFGATYYNFVGYGKKTIETLTAKRGIFTGTYFDRFEPEGGDGTVPLISALRNGRVDYRGQIQLEKGFPLDHTELASRPDWEAGSTFRFINCVVNVPDAPACIGNQLSANANRKVLNPPEFVGEPNYSISVHGATSVIVSDSFGNTTNPLSSTVDDGLVGVYTTLYGERSLGVILPVNASYSAGIIAPASEFTIVITKSDGTVVDNAVRYLDVFVPENTPCKLEVSAGGIGNLQCDSNGDGTYETSVDPTIRVNGINANDLEAPTISVNETVLGGTSRIELEAADTGTGVQKIMYSLDGSTFQQYTSPLTLDPTVDPTIYVFADDNVYNRSGLVTHNLTLTNAGFTVSGPSSSTVGSQITANWNAPSGRPQNDWIGLFRTGTLNSAFLEKQYTSGVTGGSLNFTIPNQAGTYEFRYLKEDGLTSVATSGPINVTAPPVSLSGRVIGRGGLPARMTTMVTLTDSQGNRRFAMVNMLGNYRFTNIPRGGTYTIRVTSKGWLTYSPLIVQANDNMSNVDFNPLP